MEKEAEEVIVPYPTRTVVIIAGITLVFVASAITSYFNLSKKTETDTPKTEEETSEGIPIQNQSTGRVSNINAEEKTLEIITSEGTVKTYKIKVTDDTSISRIPPNLEGIDSETAKNILTVKFEELHEGSLINVISKEDPKKNKNLTALIINVVV